MAQTVGNGMDLRGISAGVNHACALDTNGNAICWDKDNFGQLGNGISSSANAERPDSPSPTAVVGGRSYVAIAAGGQHTCAIGTDNHVYCWGSNNFGLIGNQLPQGPGFDIGLSIPQQALDA